MSLTKKRHKPSQPKLQSFILEPILTPCGLLDGGDDILDPTSLDIDLTDDISNGNLEVLTALTDILPDEIEPIDFIDNLDLSATFESGYFTVGETGEVGIDFLFDGGGYQGELAIFSLEGMEAFEPGSEEFIQEAASRALSDSELGHIVISDQDEGARFSGDLGERDRNSGEYLGVKTFQMNSGDRFGFMLVPKGSVEDVWDNPNVGGAKRPLFSMATANPDDAFHVGQIADVTGDGSTFVMEDLRVDGKSDGDYNDLVFQVRGATGNAALIDSMIDPDLDWRDTELGQEILEFAIPEPIVEDFDFPEENQPLIGVIDTGFNSANPDLDYENITLGRDRIDGDDNPLVETGEVDSIQVPSTIDATENKDNPSPEIAAGDSAQVTSTTDATENEDNPSPRIAAGDEHGTHVLGVIGAIEDNDIGIQGINDKAPLWVGRAVGSGEWAESLVEFADAYYDSEQPNAILNLSFDLTQVNPDGTTTTRYEFTPEERSAIEYARQKNILLVVSAGNDGDVMSALGQASQEFDNIITVGAADGLERADYSSYGYGLDILAPGGTAEYPVVSTVGEDIGTMTGTSVATAKVTGAASQVWAANPQLDYRQVIEILKSTAKDLNTPGWDPETGAGLVDLAAAVALARETEAENYLNPATVIPETWSGEGKVTPTERAASYPIVSESFNGWVGPDIGVNVRYSPQFSDRSPQSEPHGKTLYFDAWTYGEQGQDYWTGDSDALWYRLASTDRWVPSVYIYGYPNSRPPLLPPSQPTPKPTPKVPINSGSPNYRDYSVNPFAYEWQGQCTWYTYGRMLETGLLPNGTKQNNWFLGHAAKWEGDARRAGLPVTNTPTPGARGMVVWPPGVGGSHWQYGHVAFLEEVYPDGRIRISESNWVGDRIIGERTLTPAQYNGVRFVRLENATTNPQFPSAPAQPGKERQYIVRSGDTLSAIALRELGDANRWREIRKSRGGATFTEAEALQLQVGQSVYLPVIYNTGTGQPAQPQIITPENKIYWEEFSGTVGPKSGVNLRNSPRFNDRSSRNEPYNKRLYFDAWTNGETGTDLWLGTPDSRWFRVKGTNYWVPSAYIYGNPVGGNTKPPANPNPNPGDNNGSGSTPKDDIFIQVIKRDDRKEDYNKKANEGYNTWKANLLDHSTKLTLGGLKNSWYAIGWDNASRTIRALLE